MREVGNCVGGLFVGVCASQFWDDCAESLCTLHFPSSEVLKKKPRIGVELAFDWLTELAPGLTGSSITGFRTGFMTSLTAAAGMGRLASNLAPGLAS